MKKETQVLCLYIAALLLAAAAMCLMLAFRWANAVGALMMIPSCTAAWVGAFRSYELSKIELPWWAEWLTRRRFRLPGLLTIWALVLLLM